MEKRLSQVKPDSGFLKLFAAVVGNKWPSLAISLSLSEEKTEEMREGEEGDQALKILRKWVSQEDATYGRLYLALETISLFQY